MFRFTALQLQQTAAPAFLQRLLSFLRHTACSPVLREALVDSEDTLRFWQALWPQAETMTEHDAALFLSFRLIAQRVEGMTSADAEEACRPLPGEGISSDCCLPEIRLKRFLSDHGHLRFSAFEFPQAGTAHDAEPLPRARAHPAPIQELP
jgi:hypothetical protein